jgi:hypothetical protein
MLNMLLARFSTFKENTILQNWLSANFVTCNKIFRLSEHTEIWNNTRRAFRTLEDHMDYLRLNPHYSMGNKI